VKRIQRNKAGGQGLRDSGAYASVSEVMRDGVRALLEREAAVERWLREEVVTAHREYLADPAKALQQMPSWGASRSGARVKHSKSCAGHLYASG